MRNIKIPQILDSLKKISFLPGKKNRKITKESFLFISNKFNQRFIIFNNSLKILFASVHIKISLLSKILNNLHVFHLDYLKIFNKNVTGIKK